MADSVRLRNIIKDVIYLLPLEFLLLILFWKAITLQGIFFPGEVRSIIIPFRLWAVNNVLTDVSVTWNPHIFAGYPFSADYVAGVFYPFTYFFFGLFKPHVAMNYYIVFHYMVCTISFYYYCRILGLHRASSMLGSLTFTFSGFMIMGLCHPTIMDIISFFPFILILLEIAFRYRRWIYSAIAGFLAGVLFLGGHPQTAVYLFLFGFIYLIMIPFLNTKSSNRPNGLFTFYCSVLYSLLFIGTSMIMILPLMELISYSYRYQGVPWDSMTYGSVPFNHYIRFIFPFIFGQPYQYNYPDMNYVETCGYIGIPILLIFLLGVFFSRKNRYHLFYSCIFVIALLLALGKHSPFYSIMLHLPFLKYGRSPGRFLLFSTLSGAILAAITFDRLPEFPLIKLSQDFLYEIYLMIMSLVFIILLCIPISHSKFLDIHSVIGLDNLFRLFVLLLGALLLWLWLKQKLNTSILKKLLILLTFLDLMVFGLVLNLDANKVFPLTDFYRNPESVKFLKQDTTQYRIYTLTNKLWDFPEDRDIQFNTLHRDIGLLYGIESFNLYGNAGVNRFYEIMGELEQAYWNIPVSAQLYTLRNRLPFLSKANVKYILTPEVVDIPGLELVFNRDSTRIYKLSQTSPRAYFVSNWLNADNPQTALSLMTSDDPSIAGKTIIENYSKPSAIIGQDESLPLQIQYKGSTKVILTCTSAQNGLVILSDYYYPGWSAKVDNYPVLIYRANYLFRAVPVKKGNHQIVFTYHANSLIKGTMFASVVLIGFMIWIISLLIMKGENALF